MIRRSKLSLAPEQSAETKRVPGFEVAPPGTPEGRAWRGARQAPPASPKPRAESDRRPATAPKAKLPNTKRVLETLAVVAAAAVALYLLKRRFF